MKKLIPFFLILFLFTGCEVKEYTPEIPLTFTQKAVVTSGDFSFECEICKTQESVAVNVLSTEASGMTMTYNGDTLLFDYSDYSYSVDGKSFEPRNVAIVIYEVFDTVDTAQAKKTEGGYQYQGKITLGDFTLNQNDDNSLASIVIRNAEMVIEFKTN